MKVKPPSGRWWLLYSCCCFLAQLRGHVASPASSGAATAAATSPISQWEPSWTASCVQSTIAAVTCTLQDESMAVVVLFSSTGSSSGGGAGDSTITSKLLGTDNDKNWVELEDGLRVRFHEPDQVTTIEDANDAPLSKRWTPLGPSTVACMTGLASDVDYLTRVLQKQVDTHRICYEGSRIMPTIELVRGLQQQLRDAAIFKEGRPFGIQALMVGTRGALTQQQQPRLDIFSLDPSGGYRHWGSATAIGKKADIVRRYLYDSLSIREEKTLLTAQEAMDVAISALSQRDLNAGKSSDLSVPQALIIWTSRTKKTVSVASIDPHTVASRVKHINGEQTS